LINNSLIYAVLTIGHFVTIKSLPYGYGINNIVKAYEVPMYYSRFNGDRDNKLAIEDILEHAEIEETISRIAICFAISSVYFAEKIVLENTKLKRREKSIKHKAKKSKRALDLATSNITLSKNELEKNYQRLAIQKKLLDLERTKHDMTKMNVDILTVDNKTLNDDLVKSIQATKQCRENSKRSDESLRKSIDFTSMKSKEKGDSFEDYDYARSMQEIETVMTNLHQSLNAIDEEDNISTSDELTNDGDDTKSQSVEYPKMSCSFSSFWRWIRGSNSTQTQESILQNDI